MKMFGIANQIRKRTRLWRSYFCLTLFILCLYFIVEFLIKTRNDYKGTRIKGTFLPIIKYDLKQVNRSRINPVTWSYAKPAMSDFERYIQVQLLVMFHDLCVAENLTYFIIGGTLLGSYRHHGMLPWDDAVDILMPQKESDHIWTVFRKFSNSSKELNVAFGPGKRMKVFHKIHHTLVPIWGLKFGWPLIDVIFYNENNSEIWQYDGIYRIPKSIIFPLHQRPFDTIYLRSPRDGYAVLKCLYKTNICNPLGWSHKLEKRLTNSGLSFECEEVSRIYPFVHRKALATGGVEETLMLYDKILYTIVVDEPAYAVSRPYATKLMGHE